MTAHPESWIRERRWWILACLCLSLVLVVAGNSSLNVALPKIQADLGSAQSDLQWMVNAYGLVFAVLLLPAGALADRYGRKSALQLGMVIFGAASFVSIFATENWHLIALRGVTGLGAAFIMPGTLSILANVFHDPRERQRAIAIWAGFAGLGGAIGPILSGFLLEHYSWGSVFLISVVIAAVALVAGAYLLPNSSDPHEAILDPLGVMLAIAAVGTLLYGIIEGPDNGWTSTTTLGSIAAAVVLVGAFVTWELRNANPMLDVRLFRNRSFSVGSTTITLQYFAAFGLFFAMAQYLQIAHGYSPLQAGLAGLPIGVMSMIGAPLSATFVRRFGHRGVVGVGLIMSAGGLALLSTASPTTSLALLLVGFCLLGLGAGQSTAPSTTLIMTAVPRSKAGVGSAVNDLSRELGGALGVAVLGSVISSVYRSNIASHVGPALASTAGTSVNETLAAAQHAASSGSGAAAGALVHGAQMSFADGFGAAMVVGALVLLLNAALVWFRGLDVDPHAGGGPHGPGRPPVNADAPADPASA